MMISLASDEVWQTISWKGSATKRSFTGRFVSIQQLIENVCADTFEECTKTFCRSKMKTFIRHTDERVKRKAIRAANQPQ